MSQTRTLSFTEAIEAAGVKDDILHTADSITKRIDILTKNHSLEKVNFDMKRSALSRAVIATETSLYDRQVLERELMEWANRRAGPIGGGHDDEDDDDQDQNDDDEFGEDGDIDQDPRDLWGRRLDSLREQNKDRLRRREKKKKQLLHGGGGSSNSHEIDDYDITDPMSAAARRLEEHEEEEALDPMFELLNEKETKLSTATSALSSFTKRILGMYRAFLKIYGHEMNHSNNTIAIKMFEAETLRQLHLMETAQHSAHHTTSAAAANRAALRDRTSGVDVNAMKSTLKQVRDQLAKTSKAKLEQEDTVKEQGNRIDILELAAKELTKTVHQLRGEIRQFEEQEGRRQAAAKERRAQQQQQSGGGAGGTGSDIGSVLDEDAFSAMQGRRGSNFYGQRGRNSSYLSIGDDETDNGSFAGDGADKDNNSSESPHTRIIRVQNPAHHSKCRMIARVLALGLRKARTELRQLKHRMTTATTTSGDAALLAPSGSTRRFRSAFGAAALQLGEDIIEVGTQFGADEKSRLALSLDASSQTDVPNPFEQDEDGNNNSSSLLSRSGMGAFNNRRRSTLAPSHPSHASTARPASSSASARQQQSNRPPPVDGERDNVSAMSHFFDSLADVLQEDAKSVTRPRALRRFVQGLDEFLSEKITGSISIPLRKSIIRVRDWALREKVAQVQNAARGDVAAALASQYAAVGGQFRAKPAPATMESGAERIRPRERDVFVARPPQAVSSALKMSESAMYDVLPVMMGDDDDDDEFDLGSQQQQQQRGSSPAPSAPSGISTLKMHPAIDQKMLQEYNARAAQARMGPVQPRETRPWSARMAKAAKNVKDGVSGAKAPVTHSRFA